MTDITKLSAAKLQALYDKRSAACSVNCSKLIDAGRGMERPTEIRTKTDALSLEYVALAEAFYAVVAEMDARKRYHGSLKPIKPSKWA
jgi:hypothetical protein